MLILAKTALAMMLGFLGASILGLIIIPVLKKLKVKQTISKFVPDHEKKAGTPTMGGLIFVFSTLGTLAILLIFKKIELSYNLGLILFVFLSYSAIGFLDDFLSIKRENNVGLSRKQKFILQLIIAIGFYLIYMQSGEPPIINIYTLKIKMNLGIFYSIFILLMLVGSSNAVNITDGLDGLAGGLSFIAYLVFGIISWGAVWITNNQDIAIFCFVLAGSLLGFLLYNTHPARTFMGDTGALTLGATLASIAIITKYEVTFLIVIGVFLIEILSVVVQLISIKLFKKKVFLMSPLHHHFEKLKWQETDIVKLFWFFGLLLGMAAIIFGVWI